jgi:FkbM family methyltransferase
MILVEIVYYGLCDFAYLLRTNHSLANKLKIVFAWLRINFKFLIFDRVFKFKHEVVLGYKINAFDYRTIRFLFQEIFYKNEYIFDLKNKKPIIFDCGANIGFATIYFKWLYPESEIYAFEPDRKTFELLKNNISANKLKGVHLFNVAVYNRNGKIDFFVDPENPGSMIMSVNPARMSQEKISADCISLASFIKDNNFGKIDFVKMDVEGSEIVAVNDLHENEQMGKIMELTVEYHHKINTAKSNFGEFLRVFEKDGFEYQIDARCMPVNLEDKFQDILLHFYRRQDVF